MPKLNADFWTWFGRSRVTKNGEPMVVYHGTSRDFTKFKTPAYFAEKPDYADFFSLGNGQITPVFLAIEDPLDLTYFETKRVSLATFLDFVKDQGVELGELKNTFKSYFGSSKDVAWAFIRSITADSFLSKNFTDALKEAGYDGVLQYEDVADKRARVWIALDPRQIKSAIGNDGSWDSNDPDIRSNPHRRAR